jgi:hypothetical protein
VSDEERLDPAVDQFVMRVRAADHATIERARQLGAVERFDSEPQLCLLRLPHAKSSKQTWRDASRALGEDVSLFPVLYDRDGTAHYPTGEVTVRFESNPSDAELKRFCGAQRLRLLRRNEFATQQVVCEPITAPREFLPDLVSRLTAQPGVRRAWANTLSRYRRAEKQG